MKGWVKLFILLFWTLLFFGMLYFPKWHFLVLNPRSLSLFVWGDFLDPTLITRFEKKTGIKVHLNFYYSNEELVVKLKETKGEGYDLIVPSDYTVKILSEAGLLKKIDKDKLSFFSRLNPRLLHLPFDPENRYSIPYFWSVYGFGINREEFKIPEAPSWNLVFSPQSYKITMVNDPIDVVALASFYLFGPKETLSFSEAESVKALLSLQRGWIEAYTQDRGPYFLATRNCPLVLSTSSNVGATMLRFPFIDFLLPNEGTFISVEHLCIPNASKKEKLAYQLINFLFQEESVKKNYERYLFYPALKISLAPVDGDARFDNFLKAADISFEKTHFFRKLLPARELDELWIKVKSEH
ncbi:MAG TPA: hypothetical protein DCY54_03120 [Parachlamydiales bacterium]|nr:MAG: hypothetical protein A2Z85_00115 [Chlamydiae bacterium GWA2_50_15]OGN58911.1 MAG: hypothetical protein A3D18_01555 [Chlamydiae bacterium RIFCSPHIGHO2_02_FULL_49_29]OGN63262.1 MAG: hypothetical protein A3E26_05310 [Chlamydiae bacterium RIFCSPHIGHO2_12_FULL_49_32]HAZ15612.1 hypothetical protein [Parachlamydiales bacterium]HCJ82969.1 hypothetical protein [Parachlamydiales bacterium]